MIRKIQIRIRLGDITFPDVCPVCGERATTTGRIEKMLMPPPKRMDLLYGRDLEYFQRGIIHYEPLVCKQHVAYGGRTTKSKALLSAIGVVIVFLALLVLANITFTIYDRLQINPDRYVLLGILLVLIFFVMYGLRPSPLEQAISIKKVVAEGNYAILSIKNLWYAVELVRLNPHRAIHVKHRTTINS
ncbi:MAG: hypothetical protein K9W43_12720 [Candidatus Thorarchaeota archaeon]|nr:hypothetical protein [Candidatus Thorarchaeota archaeon]